MIDKPGHMIRIINDVVIDSQNESLDLHRGDTGIVLGTVKYVFDPDNPGTSTETLFKCLVNGQIEHLFEIDFEFILEEGEYVN